MTALPFIVLLSACGPTPEARDAAAYAQAMAPLQAGNARLAATFGDLAPRLQDGGVDLAIVRARLVEEVVPEAERLAAEAAALKVPAGALGSAHQYLVIAWRKRAGNWRALAEATEKGDRAGIAGWRRASLDAHVQEEDYLQRVAAATAGTGVSIDLYP